jgi:hypothetical protein
VNHRLAVVFLAALSTVFAGCSGDDATSDERGDSLSAFCERLEDARSDGAFLDLADAVPAELTDTYGLIRAHVESGTVDPPDDATQAAYRDLADWSVEHCALDLTEPADPTFVPISAPSTTVVIPPLEDVEPAALAVPEAAGHWVSDDGLADLTVGTTGEVTLLVRSARVFTCTGLVAHSAVVHRYEATVSAPVRCVPTAVDDAVGEVEGVLELVMDPERDTMKLVEIPGGVSVRLDAEPVTACADVSVGQLVGADSFASRSCVLRRA